MRSTAVWALALGAWLAAATTALAASPLNPNLSMHDTLTALAQAKTAVTVVLKNGTSYRARVGALGDHMVVLTEPQGKEFFDVLVPIEEISALEVRAREP